MPRPSVVLDTNVVVSAHLNPDGYERFVLDLGIAGKIQIYVSANILDEYRGVLRREKFGIDPELVDASLGLIMRSASMVQPARRVGVAKDQEDNKFLECAHESGSRLSGHRQQTAFSKAFWRHACGQCARISAERHSHAKPQELINPFAGGQQ